MIQGLGSRVQGSGFRIKGLGDKDLGYKQRAKNRMQPFYPLVLAPHPYVCSDTVRRMSSTFIACT